MKNRSWSACAKRVVIQVTNYLDFAGKYSPGGRQRYVKNIAFLIRNQWGRDVLIVQKAEKAFRSVCPEGFEVFGIESNLRAVGDPIFSYRVKSLLKDGDVLLYASGEDAWPFWTPGSKAIQHGVWWDGPESLIVKSIQRRRIMSCLRNVRSMLCVDTNFINWVRCQGKEGLDLVKKCVYIPNYADVSRLKISTEDKKTPIRLFCARRYDPRRGINLFIDSLSILRARGIDFVAHISSPGGLIKINEALQKRSLSSLVSVTEDSMDEVLDRYADSDVTVVPTIWSEGTSLSCVEAICCGNPVVATPVGGIGNLIIPGFNGFIVNPTPESIAEGISRFLNFDLLKKMRKNCLSMRESLSFEAWGASVLDWLQD